MRKSAFGIVFVTCPSRLEAEKLARGMLENRLAACVNIIKAVDSFFWWKGKIDHAQEFLLIIKTKEKLFKVLERYVKTRHSYQVPEVILIPIAVGHRPYLDWMVESLKTKR